MALKSEKSFKEYLKKLSDDTIIKYYSDVEYSPFPVLIIQEYTRRFEQKSKNEILKDLKLQTRLARKKTQEISKMAKKHTSAVYQKQGVSQQETTSESSAKIIKTKRSLTSFDTLTIAYFYFLHLGINYDHEIFNSHLIHCRSFRSMRR